MRAYLQNWNALREESFQVWKDSSLVEFAIATGKSVFQLLVKASAVSML